LHKPALSERTCLNFLKLIKLTDWKHHPGSL
jgi:hypothetical protein